VISVPIGVANPWGTLSSLSLLLLLVFFVDATITVWRGGNRRRALFVGGSMIFGAILAWHVPLVIWGVIETPFFLCFAYSGIGCGRLRAGTKIYLAPAACGWLCCSCVRVSGRVSSAI
jgi:hypothetical protein